MAINRRDLLTGSAVLLGTRHLELRTNMFSSGAVRNAAPATGVLEKPKNLLASTFTAELLSKSLLSVTDWHPYPKIHEREAWQQVDKEVAEKAIDRAEKVNGTAWEILPATAFLEYKRTGNRQHFEGRFFKRRTRLMDLVLGECVEGKGRFLEEIVNGVWLECEETFWGVPAHLNLQRVHPGSGLPDVEEPIVDLFAADAGAVMSWIHYLLGEQLNKINPMITRRIEVEVKRRILDPALNRDDFLWMFKDYRGEKHRLNNWTPWIGSNWLTANLLLEPDANRRKAATQKICRSVDQYLEGYSDDACCQEGPGYWNVSPGSYFDCCMLLTSATDGAGDPLKHPFIRKMFRYIADVHINGPWFVDYGDAPPKMEESGEFVYRIGTAINDDVLKAYGAFNASAAALKGEAVSDDQGHLGRAFPSVLVSAKAIGAVKKDAMVRDSWYPTLGLMTARIKEDSIKGFYLAMQAAPNQRPHGHNDSGSFIVFHDGNPVFVDIGPEAYTAARYKFSIQSAFHNLPTIGGVMQSNQDPRYRADDLHYSTSDISASVSTNLANAYPNEAGIDSWKRTLVLDRKANEIHLTEDFKLRKKVDVQLSLMTPCVPRQEGDGRILLPPADPSARTVSLEFDPALIAASIEKIDLTDEWLTGRWGKSIYRILLKSTGAVNAGEWQIALRAH